MRIVCRGGRVRSGRAAASSSRSRSRRASSIASARSTCTRTCARSIRRSCGRGCGSYPGDVYNAEAVEKSVEDMTIEASRHGYSPSRRCVRAPIAISQTRTGQPRLHDRGRAARLYRADQHPRQYPHARLRDPARVRPRRRRCLQPRADQPRRAPPEEPELLQDREDHHRARLGARSRRSSMSTSRSSRPASSRSPAAIRPPTASWPRSASPSATCSAAACTPRPPCSTARYAHGLSAVVRRAVSPRLSRGARPRPLRRRSKSRRSFVSYETSTIGGASRFGFALREDLGLQLRYSLYQPEGLAAGTSCSNCNNINPDFDHHLPDA